MIKLRERRIRAIIRKMIKEEAWVPGRWMPRQGEPVDRDDLDDLGENDSELNEKVDFTKQEFKKAKLDSFQDTDPGFHDYLLNNYSKEELASAAYAYKVGSGLLGGLKRKVPIVAFEKSSEPLVYWDDNRPKMVNMGALGQKIRSL
jgi:hypothetical protein